MEEFLKVVLQGGAREEQLVVDFVLTQESEKLPGLKWVLEEGS